MNSSAKDGKSALAKMLMKKLGLSKRKAELAVKTVFDAWVNCLAHGETVETPVGWIQVKAVPETRRQQLLKLRNIQTGEKFFRLGRLPKKMIWFIPKKALIQRGPFEPPPPPPLSPALIAKGEELEALIARLGFSRFSKSQLNELSAAADGDLDRLLARLREYAKEERVFDTWLTLCASVRNLYWIRK
jgi:nucleoid DNA-binding protein